MLIFARPAGGQELRGAKDSLPPYSAPPCPEAGVEWHNCDGYRQLRGDDFYFGRFKNNQYHGEGALSLENGMSYAAEWMEGKRSGQGTFTSNDGAIYEGQWENDEFSGEGKITFVDGSTSVGTFKNGLRHGQGTWKGVDGRIDKGGWSEGKKSG